MRFEVIETFHDFQLVDTITGRSASMGDGVDVEGFIGGFVEVGDEGFAEAWADDANENIAEYLEAYFSDLYNLEVYDSPKLADRYTVILEEASHLEKSMQDCTNLHYCLALSDNPEHPLGVSQHGYVDPDVAAWAGARVFFLDLPLNVQEHIARRLEE